MATDTAFALGVLTIVRKCIPASLLAFTAFIGVLYILVISVRNNNNPLNTTPKSSAN